MPSEAVVADDSAPYRQRDRGWHDSDRAALVEALVRACLVIVGQEPFQHRLQVAGAEYQQVVYEPFRDRVRSRTPVREPQDFEALRAEDLVEAGAELHSRSRKRARTCA